MFVEDVRSIRPLVSEALETVGNGDFSAWLDANPEFVGRIIANVKIIDVNRAAVELNGAASVAELLCSLGKLVMPETLTAFKELLCVMAAGGGYYTGFAWYRSLSGREYQTMNSCWVPAADDEVQVIAIATVDITEMKQAEMVLVESERCCRRLIESLPDVVIQHDLSGQVTFVNEAGLRVLGRSASEVPRLSLAEVVKQVVGDTESLTKQPGDGTILYETELLTKIGHEIAVEVSVTVLPGRPEIGVEPQVLLLARDISQRRRAQTAELCNQLQFCTGMHRAPATQTYLNEIVVGLAPLLNAAVGGSRMVKHDLGVELPEVLVNRAEIGHLILSLVAYAAESVRDRGGQIVIGTGVVALDRGDLDDLVFTGSRAPGKYVSCTVRAEGAGGGASATSPALDPRSPANAALQTALGVVNDHAGAVRIANEPGQGSAMTFWLPVPTPAAGTHPATGSGTCGPEVDLNGRTVLLVDDDVDNRGVAGSLLRRLGCRILFAADGFEAVRIFGQRHREIDAVFLDFSMPHLDGARTCERLRVIRHDVPLLMSSAADAEHIAEKCGNLGLAGFVAKPYSLAELRQTLSLVIGR